MEKITLAEICRARGVSGDVFDLPFLEACEEWLKRSGGYIPPYAEPPVDGDYLPATG